MIHQSHCWAYIQEKNIILKAICIPLHCSTLDNSQDIEEAAVYREMNGQRCGIHIQWNVTEPQKEGNNVICNNTDEPRDYHTK